MHHRPNVCRQIFWQRVYPQIPSVVHASVGIGHGAGANTYLAQPKNVAWGGAKPKRCGTSNGQIFSCDLTTYPTPKPTQSLASPMRPYYRRRPPASPPAPSSYIIAAVAPRPPASPPPLALLHPHHCRSPAFLGAIILDPVISSMVTLHGRFPVFHDSVPSSKI